MDKNRARARLVEQGSSLRAWAIANGFQPRTVAQALHRWAGKNRPPRGLTTYRILNKLSQEIGEEITKGVLTRP